MKKLSSAGKKAAGSSGRKLTIVLSVLPVVVAAAAAGVWFFMPVIAERPVATSDPAVNPQEIIDKINISVAPPEPETQEKSAEIAEQKRIEAEKRRAEAEARALALRIKQARDEARNKICFIGDSITRGGAANQTIAILNTGHSTEDPPYDGINIAEDGSTTNGWIGMVGTAAHNCNKSGLKMVMIMLGTNDAGQDIPSATYFSNMAHIKSIVNGLGVPVVVNCPIAHSDPETQTFIEEYCAGLGANGVATPLVVPLADGIHPDGAGYGAIASAWANIIRSIVGI